MAKTSQKEQETKRFPYSQQTSRSFSFYIQSSVFTAAATISFPEFFWIGQNVRLGKEKPLLSSLGGPETENFAAVSIQVFLNQLR